MSLPGITIDDALTRLRDAEGDTTYEFVNRIAIDKDSNSALLINENKPLSPVSVSIRDDNFLKYMSHISPLPHSYATQIEDDSMLQDLVGYHLNKLTAKEQTSNNMIVASLSPSRDPMLVSRLQGIVRPSEILEGYVNSLKDTPREELAVNSLFTQRDQKVEFSVLSEKWNMEFLQARDISYFGVRFDWPGFLIAPSVFASSHRPSCGNLMCGTQNVGKIRASFADVSHAAVMKRFMTGAARASNYIDTEMIPRLAASVNVKIEDFPKFLEAFKKQHKLQPEDALTLLEAWGEEKGDTMYHVYQACTRVATYTSDDKCRRHFYVLADAILGGIDMPVCTHCHQQLPGSRRRRNNTNSTDNN